MWSRGSIATQEAAGALPRQRLERVAQRARRPLGRIGGDARGAPLAQRRAQLAVADGERERLGGDALVVGVAQQQRRVARDLGTPPIARAITGTPKWKASSSGMQKPSCSDMQRNALAARQRSASCSFVSPDSIVTRPGEISSASARMAVS